MKTDRQETRKRIDEWFDLNKDDMIRDLGRLIAVKSVADTPVSGAPFGPGPREALTAAADMLTGRGFSVTEFEDIVITADLGAGEPELGILAHLDVVSADGAGWESDPFELTVTPDKLIGRGATDNKGPAVAAMYAMYAARDILGTPGKGFRLILGSGEELGCGDVAAYMKKNRMPPNVFTPDSDFPVVNIEKGRFVMEFESRWAEDARTPRVVSITGGGTANIVPGVASAVVEGISPAEMERVCREYSEKTGAAITYAENAPLITVTASGTASHASRPQDGINAQTALLSALCALPLAETIGHTRLRALCDIFPHGDSAGKALGIDMSDAETGVLTLNFGVLEYSESGLSGSFDSRTPSCADNKDLEGMARAALAREDITVTTSSRTLCHHTPGDSPFVQSLLSIYSEYTGLPGKCLAVGGTTYAHGIPGGVAFGCEMEGVSNLIHGDNEFIGVRQLMMSAKMFTAAIIDMCE